MKEEINDQDTVIIIFTMCTDEDSWWDTLRHETIKETDKWVKDEYGK